MTAESRSDNDIYQLVVISDQQYALPVQSIICVSALENILPLPKTPHWISGVVHIRNAIVPVINLNELINVANPASKKPFTLGVLLRHPLDPGRWLVLCVTDLANVINKVELAEMSSRSPSHPCLINVLENESQTIQLLDIRRLFEQLIKESD